jgi:hypothetical protein
MRGELPLRRHSPATARREAVRPHRPRPPLAAILCALVALAAGGSLAGCGGDDEKDAQPASKERSVTTAPPTTRSRPATQPAPSEQSGGNTTPDPSREDSPENDLPPEPGSPQERFEQDLERRCGKNGEKCPDY